MTKFQVFRHDTTGRHPVGPLVHDDLWQARMHLNRCMRRAASGSRVGAWGQLVSVAPGVWTAPGWDAHRQPAAAGGIWFEIEQIDETNPNKGEKMRHFYRVYEYDKTTDITENPVFFHDRENAEAYFNKLAQVADASDVDIHKNSMTAFGFERSVFFEVLNFED